MVNILIVTHGEFGAYAVEAAETIVGVQTGVRSIPITPRMTVEDAKARLAAALDELAGPDGIVMLTDIPGGTRSNLSLPLSRERAGVVVLSGLNLYMLVTAFSNRTLPLEELSQKLLKNAASSILDLSQLLRARAKTRVP